MKIAFWSNGDYSSGVTSNLACISVASTFEYAHKSIVFESHQQKNRLEDMIRYNIIHKKREISNYTKQLGMNRILNYYLKNEELKKKYEQGKEEMLKIESNLIHDSSLGILEDRLFYIPTDYVSNHYMYEYKLYHIIKDLLSELDQFADITYIDTSSHKLSSKIIIDEADLIVVNLLQNSKMLEDFFSNYSSIFHKCVFLISNYQMNSHININYISSEYLIHRDRIVAIPSNDDYQLALQEGSLVGFLARNYKCNSSNPNYVLTKQIKRAVHMIHKFSIESDNSFEASITS